VYEEILNESRQFVKDVKNGPGTGKSVVAVKFLDELTKED